MQLLVRSCLCPSFDVVCSRSLCVRRRRWIIVHQIAPLPPPAASSFYVDLARLPNFHRLPSSPPLHIWAGHLLAEQDNFIPPGPNETPHPNLAVQNHLYFVLIKARRPSDRERTIWWFNGGPGCSSFDGLMMEVGPWRMDKTGELREIEGGWEEYANIIYGMKSDSLMVLLTQHVVDQPVGTGFSYGSTDRYAAELTDVCTIKSSNIFLTGVIDNCAYARVYAQLLQSVS